MGGKTGQTTQTVQIPPEVLARYNAVNAQAQATAATPFQAYSNDPNAFVAPINQQQQMGIGNVNSGANLAQPAFNAAMAGTYGAAQAMDPSRFGAGVQNYMSPYLQQAVGATAAQMNNVNQQQQQQMLGSMIGQGAFGGDRANMGLSALMNQQNLAMGQTISGMENQGFQNAAQNYFTGLGQQGNLYNQLGQLGAGAQNAALQGANAQIGAGSLEQQTEQAGKSALYNQFQQSLAYPFQTAQFLANIAEGTGALSGQTQTTTQPVGFLSGLFKDGGRVGKRAGGGLMPHSEGGHVSLEHMGEGYADGGSPMDYSDMVMKQLFGGMNPEAGAYGLAGGMPGGRSYVPQSQMQARSLPALAAPAAQQSSGDPIQGIDKDIKAGQDLYNQGKSLYNQMSTKAPDSNPVVSSIYSGDLGGTDASSALGLAAGGRTGLADGGMPYETDGGYMADTSGNQQSPALPKIGAPPAADSSGLGKIATAAGDIAKIAALFASGGLAVRKGYDDGGSTYDDLPGDILDRVALLPIPAAPPQPIATDQSDASNMPSPAAADFPLRQPVGTNAYFGGLSPNERDIGYGEFTPSKTGAGLAAAAAPVPVGADDAHIGTWNPDLSKPPVSEQTGLQTWQSGNRSSRDLADVVAPLANMIGGRSPLGEAYDWATKTPSQIAAETATQKTQSDAAMQARDWYSEPKNWATVGSDPIELAKAKADPLGYWKSQVSKAPVAAAPAVNNGTTGPQTLVSPAPSSAGLGATPDARLIPGTPDYYLSQVEGKGSAGIAPPIPMPRPANLGMQTDLYGNPRPSISTSPTETQAGYDPTNTLYRGVTQIESNGNYGALGPITKNGDRAYGIGQVMGANIPSWTKKWYGQELTPQQFLNNKAAQNAVVRGQLGEYYKQTGNMNDAVSMWFSGRKYNDAAAAGVKDVLGTTAPGYLQKFNAAISGKSIPPTSQANALGAPISMPQQATAGQPGGGLVSPQAIAAATGQPAGQPSGGLAGIFGGIENALAGDPRTARPGLLLPILSALGTMGSSRVRNPFGLLLQGIGSGADTYANRQAQLANIGSVQASTLTTMAGLPARSIIESNGIKWVPVYNKDGTQSYMPLEQFATTPGVQSIFSPAVDQRLKALGLMPAAAIRQNQQDQTQQQDQGQQPLDEREFGKADQTEANNAWNLAQQTPLNVGKRMLDWNNQSENINRSADTAIQNYGNNAETNAIISRSIANKDLGKIAPQLSTLKANAISVLSNLLGISTSGVDDPQADSEILDKIGKMTTDEIAQQPGLSDAYARWEELRKVRPNIGLEKSTAAEISAYDTIRNQQAIDRQSYYPRFAAASHGVLTNVESALNNHYQYNRERTTLKQLMLGAEENPLIADFFERAREGAFNRGTKEQNEALVNKAFVQMLGKQGQTILNQTPYIARYFTR